MSEKIMTQPKHENLVYLVLASMFITSTICATVIFGKFIHVNLFNVLKVEFPAGVLVFPVTFLVTDLISELYGKEKANQVVISGLIANAFIVGVLWLVDLLPASGHTILSDAEFHKAFRVSTSTFLAGMAAFTCSQFVDIRIFHFVKDLTQGRWLWARNNLSTITAQLIDTTIFLFILFVLDVLPAEVCLHLLMPMFTIKLVCALFDTPFFYLGVRLLSRKRQESENYPEPLKQEAPQYQNG